jgi:ribosomal protein S27AE
LDSDPDLAGFDPASSERVVEAPIMGVPTDNTTLTEVLNGMRELGFGTSFTAQDGARLRCGHCEVTSAATAFVVEDTRRLEGASDPDDLVTVVAAFCPECGSGGSLVLGYGVNATPEDAAAAASLRGSS